MRAILASQVLPYLHQLWRYKWLSIGVAWLVCAIGWPFVAVMPPKYEADTRIYLNADPVLTPLLRGLAVDDNPSRQVDYLQRTLLSRANLQQIAKLSNFDMKLGGNDSRIAKESLLQELARNVLLRQQTENLITIGFFDRDPTVARDVVQALLTVFSENAAGLNRNQMDNAKRFIDQEIQHYEEQLKAAERRRADFRQKYRDLIPSYDGTLSRIDAGRSQIAQLELDVADARSRRDSLQKDLDTLPKLVSIDAAGPQVVVAGHPIGYRARLDAARARLDDLLMRFTEQHPDVIATQKQIRELEAKVAQGKESDTTTARKSDVANPTYEQVRLKLIEAETALVAVERRMKFAKDEQALLEDRAQKTPGVQAQAEDLDRDYNINKRNFEELVSRREQALIGEAADTKANKIEFRIIDPPQVPIAPIAPNRPMLFSGVLAVAIGAAVALPFLLLQFDKSFTSLTAVRALGFPVLGSVSWIVMPTVRRRVRFQIAGLCVGVSILVVVYSVLIGHSFGLVGLPKIGFI
jgi:polysaccharide chain length determinant protein (PEP-CTERM system associated)